MLTRRLSQRVLTLSLPKVNRRKRRQMRYFCVLTRRCASRPSSERKNWARRNSRREWLYSHRKGGSTTRVAAVRFVDGGGQCARKVNGRCGAPTARVGRAANRTTFVCGRP